MDDLTLALLGGGGVALALWYASRSLERRRELRQILKGVPVMPQSSDPKAQALAANLPATLDLRALTTRVEQNIQIFRQTPGLLDQWLIALRSRYRTPWEIELLDQAQQILTKQIALMDVGVEHKVKLETLTERVETGKLRAQTDLFNAQVEHEEAQAKSGGRVKTARLRAENEALTEEALRAELRERKAKAEKTTRDHKTPASRSQSERPPTLEESIDTIRENEAAKARRAKAHVQGRLDGELKWRADMRRERDAKTAAVQADPTLTDEQKLIRIEEIEEAYGNELARRN